MQVQINNLCKTYRGNVRALANVSLTIPPGIFGLLGPNGAGKTSLIRILVGILYPTSGHVLVGPYDSGTEIGRQAIKKLLGYLPQDHSLYPEMKAYDFLDYMGLLKGLDNHRERRKTIDRVLELVALRDVAKRPLKTFSGGMKRRVGIAQALLNNPKLLIVDEPTAGLDPEERLHFRNLLTILGNDCTIILSTHITEDIAQTCQNIAVLKDGSILYQGSIADIIDRSRKNIWEVTTDNQTPPNDSIVISTIHMGEKVQYRIVGEPAAYADARPIEPALEDSYIWLLYQQRKESKEV
jgi:ABC-type multidrug transport system ATPase subunit